MATTEDIMTPIQTQYQDRTVRLQQAQRRQEALQLQVAAREWTQHPQFITTTAVPPNHLYLVNANQYQQAYQQVTTTATTWHNLTRAEHSFWTSQVGGGRPAPLLGWKAMRDGGYVIPMEMYPTHLQVSEGL